MAGVAASLHAGPAGDRGSVAQHPSARSISAGISSGSRATRRVRTQRSQLPGIRSARSCHGVKAAEDGSSGAVVRVVRVDPALLETGPREERPLPRWAGPSRSLRDVNRSPPMRLALDCLRGLHVEGVAAPHPCSRSLPSPPPPPLAHRVPQQRPSPSRLQASGGSAAIPVAWLNRLPSAAGDPSVRSGRSGSGIVRSGTAADRST